MSTRGLPRLLGSFSSEVRALREVFTAGALASSEGFDRNPEPYALRGYATVRLHDAWARFVRATILESAAGGSITLAGTPVPRSTVVPSGASPLQVLRSKYPPQVRNKPLWEPKWFDATEALDAASRLQIANYPSLSAALGARGTAVEDLRACRNFITHRGVFSNGFVDAIRNRDSMSLRSTVDDVMLSTVAGGGIRFEAWCYELLQRARTACA